MLLITSVK